MFGDEEYVLGDIPLLRASREPCIICGHPTGDCHDTGSRPPIRIIGAEFGSQRKKEPGVLVEEDMYEDVWLTPYTMTTVLVAKAGTYITLEKAIELGIKDP